MTGLPVFRFAPSPNGELHLGHAYSALVTYRMARSCGGRFLLRIEDIDTARCHPHFEAQIKEDLAWLGLEWEKPPRRQSEHFSTYKQALTRLEKLGLLYPCFASRKEIISAAIQSDNASYPTDPDGAPLYPGLYKNCSEEEVNALKTTGRPYALRIDMARAKAMVEKEIEAPLTFLEISTEGDVSIITAQPERWGDAVIARKDIPTSYHLSVVVDDALQGVTHVTRGRDLFAATDMHRLLQVLLELPAPLYHHHKLIKLDTGRKLSKREQDKSLRALREDGLKPDDILRLLGFVGDCK